jgi:outer membrane murein-binding lipoprotein Lpp
MLRFIAVFVGIACLAGCTSPPVQEMSDARQAIAAARVAGATEVTSPDLYAAQAAITRAEKHIDAQEYTRARLAALEAKHHAGAALNDVQRTDAQNADAQSADGQPVDPHAVLPAVHPH